jgi:hypothetical protein
MVEQRATEAEQLAELRQALCAAEHERAQRLAADSAGARKRPRGARDAARSLLELTRFVSSWLHLAVTEARGRRREAHRALSRASVLYSGVPLEVPASLASRSGASAVAAAEASTGPARAPVLPSDSPPAILDSSRRAQPKVLPDMSLYDERLPLEAVLGDAALLEAFKTYSAEQHAAENVLFWAAVEAFKAHSYSKPNVALIGVLDAARASASASASATATGSALSAAHSQIPASRAGAAAVPGVALRKKKCSVAETQFHINMAATLKLPMERVAAIIDALKIYETFLQDGARLWVCVTPSVRDEIAKTLLRHPEGLRQALLFHKAAREARATMEKDLLPRFLSKRRDDPLVAERVVLLGRLRSEARARTLQGRLSQLRPSARLILTVVPQRARGMSTASLQAAEAAK